MASPAERVLAAQVALESGTSAFFVTRELTRFGLRPVVADAHEVHGEAVRPHNR